MDKQILKMLVTTAYSYQKLRISTGNRLGTSFRIKLGIEPSESKIDAETKKVLNNVMADHRRLADAVAALGRRKFDFDGEIITSREEFDLVSHYVALLQSEQDAMKSIARAVKKHPLWKHFFVKVRGAGPTMAAVLIATLDIRKAKHVSSFWKYIGIDVGPDGKGRSRRKEHLVDVEYEDADGEIKTRKSITYNSWLKSKVMGILADCLLVQGKYRDIYDGYRNRLEHHPNHKDKAKGHKHMMSKRYMVKQFLRDLWVEWRTLEGLLVEPPYHVAKLDMPEHSKDKAA